MPTTEQLIEHYKAQMRQMMEKAQKAAPVDHDDLSAENEKKAISPENPVKMQQQTSNAMEEKRRDERTNENKSRLQNESRELRFPQFSPDSRTALQKKIEEILAQNRQVVQAGDEPASAFSKRHEASYEDLALSSMKDRETISSMPASHGGLNENAVEPPQPSDRSVSAQQNSVDKPAKTATETVAEPMQKQSADEDGKISASVASQKSVQGVFGRTTGAASGLEKAPELMSIAQEAMNGAGDSMQKNAVKAESEQNILLPDEKEASEQVGARDEKTKNEQEGMQGEAEIVSAEPGEQQEERRRQVARQTCLRGGEFAMYSPPANTGNSDDCMQQTPPALTDKAYLHFEVFAAQRAYPIENALIRVRSASGDDLLSVLSTDQSGNTARLELPAPDRTLSLNPDTPNPFVMYRADIRAEGYEPQSNLEIQLFGGIESVLSANMIPQQQLF